jgi:hypothetical protein
LGNFFCPQLCFEGLNHGLLFRNLYLFVHDRPITGSDSWLELGNIRCVILQFLNQILLKRVDPFPFSYQLGDEFCLVELIWSDSAGGAPSSLESSLGVGVPWVVLRNVLLHVIVNREFVLVWLCVQCYQVPKLWLLGMVRSLCRSKAFRYRRHYTA